MQVIALVGNKGGTGKTTLAINLASMLNEKAPTILLDADPQGSSMQWKQVSDTSSLEVDEASEDTASIIDRTGGYDYCVVDCPPSVQSSQTREVLRRCNVALIPVQPSPLDMWASIHVEREVAEAYQVNESMRALLVINQLEPRTRLSQLALNAMDELELPCARTSIKRRAAHRNAVLEGRSIADVGWRGREAAKEIRQLIDELGF